MIEEENLSNSDDLIDEDDDVLESRLQQLATEESKCLSNQEEISVESPTPPATSDEPKAEASKASAAAAATLEKINGLIAESTSLKEQLDDRKQQYLRLYADFENFRKRTERDKEELEGTVTGKILKKILPVVDDFERAQLQILPKNDGEAAIHKSYQSVYKQLLKCLKETGVARMEAVGQEFDPNFHEAIMQEPSAEYDEGIITEELRPGYLVSDDRVLRHALVKVSSGKIDGAESEPENGLENSQNNESGEAS
ncbi:MAG: nucleotide exchange factor GrpE [Pseudanabaena sp.]|jgi:molecular chaperone GrpE|uniref:nucleotide exchange factor GrpE n=1 Tax=Pseudanabaena mucicola TaxID=71190 RepID=UPI0025787179|nr:nucleotide exchange factor GrpE [Pseudanabaena mucicola]MCA6574990.1 nucleotide exchange factor GrpE [Pseudanabaena sp. M53BS1SP1A06MG]MCA6582098.1 nucleotide exchange factor GrpE [Pseudanabaena sp. M34BS1SP1A06MG]MCA6586879.1 nucleotide exchange factor GrpE [Pseudanabaena sp. M051S1SP1A06QC]MCA6590020.1 nucleotide exchange factor GrpE [Pseudanabaena sp. M109S1SP1A06QC]MCA6592207.1 nucleotide exchange factor GrpE [Pseudanabaena sp. M38BS1SP1A06MG]MCA6596356.1 nucleotide exchange factor Grp